GALPLSLEQLYDETAGIYTWSIGEAPQFQVFDIRAEVYQHAGASAAQELGFAMATGAEYLRAMIRRNFSA
ncbi:MAG: methylmalonyl-CoA mutase, partial [Calditrichaeota bacterium]|nr:methylmalonyl-CoA mutase [Calditrichota bacterium]